MASTRRSTFWAWLHGCAIGAITYVWSLTGGTWNLLSNRGLNIHDVQARALLNGHLAAPKGALSIEAFVIDGREYSYFGLVPALLRIPILCVAPQLEGRLSIVSMLAAYVVFALGSAWFLVELLPRLSVERRTERIIVTALGFAASGASALTMIAAAPNHYHESLIWGLGLSMAALAAILSFVSRPTGRSLGFAAVLSLAAAHARTTTGLAVAVVLVLAVVWTWFQGRLRPASPRTGLCYTGLAAIPGLSVMAINYVKFKMPIGLPMANQVFTGIDQHRQAMLAANDGKYFRLAFAPTNLWQYGRPDFAGFSAKFPFLQLPHRSAAIIGDLIYDQVDFTSSVWGALPAFMLWGLCGLALFVTIRSNRQAFGGWRTITAAKERTALSLIVGVLSIIPVAMIGFIGNRYLIDFMPLLITFGLVGLGVWQRNPQFRRIAVVATLAATAVGALFSTSVAFAQHGTALDPAVVRNQVRWSLVAARLGIGASPRIEAWNPLIPAGAEGDLMIVGECEALYRSDGSATTIVNPTNWRPVERSTQFGAFRLSVNARALTSLDQLLDSVDGGDGGDGRDGRDVDPTHGLKVLETVSDGDSPGEDGSDAARPSTAVFVDRVGPADARGGRLRFSVVSDNTVLASGEADIDSLPFTLDVLADRVLSLISVRVNDKPIVSVDSPIGRIALRPDTAGWLSEDDMVRPPLALCASARSLRDGS